VQLRIHKRSETSCKDCAKAKSRIGANSLKRVAPQGDDFRTFLGDFVAALTLFIEGQLLSQEEDFGAESGMGTDGFAEEPQSVADQIDGESEERSQWAYRAGEESQHGASGWHTGGLAKKCILQRSRLFLVSQGRETEPISASIQ